MKCRPIMSIACAAVAAFTLYAAPVKKVASTATVGDVQVVCAQPGEWTVDLKSAPLASGVDVLTLRLSAPKPVLPPQLVMSFEANGAGVRHVWTSDYSKDAPRLWPNGWEHWRGSSQLAFETPLTVAIDGNDTSHLALACSDAFNKVDFGIVVKERTGDLMCRFRLFANRTMPIKSYEAKFLIDARKRFFGDAIAEASAWIAKTSGLHPAHVPEAALEPLYSTWYAYLQDVHADVLEREAKLAADVGMKTMILDDGWQKEESLSFYSKTGDWQPVTSRFPDMKAHVEAVHRAGLKYMIWYSVPYVGEESAAWGRFKDKFIRIHGSAPARIGVLDPRFPDVREYLVKLYERTVGEWKFDGLKLDFIDQFALSSDRDDPVTTKGMAGRDIRALPEAVDVLMKTILARVKAINPDVLIEFRQHYCGPAILQYGNMVRAADAPVDPAGNRRRIADLRLTSGNTAVHSDMVVWDRDETPEGAAQAILSALYSVVQYSMILDGIRDDHKAVIRHWIAFMSEHRDTLLKGKFRPHHPELGYPMIEAEAGSERIATLYGMPSLVALVPGKRNIVVNATDVRQIPVSFDCDRIVTVYDTFGRQVSEATVKAGPQIVDIPASGYAIFR